MTYKFSLAFVCLTGSSQRPLSPLRWPVMSKARGKARHTQYTLINITETALGMAENHQQQGAGKSQHPLTSNSLCIDWQAKLSKDTLFYSPNQGVSFLSLPPKTLAQLSCLKAGPPLIHLYTLSSVPGTSKESVHVC